MKKPFHYRNKAQYPLGINSKGEAMIGVYAQRTHEVISMQKCFIQNELCQEIACDILEFIKEKKIEIYQENTQKGLVRHIVTRIGIKTNEVMCILVLNGRNLPHESELIERLKKKFPPVKTIIKNINTKNTNVILGKENITVYGNRKY